MNALRTILLTGLLALAGAGATFGAATAQEGNITGQVTDAATGAPLVGVQVVVVGTNIGSLTDQNGRYLLLRVPTGSRQVQAILIGYALATQPVTVTTGEAATANFRLSQSAVDLEAIIVSGATGREQRARELGSKVANIDVENLNPAPITTLADVLGARASGVTMQDVNGTTGTSQRIRIRGANSVSLSNEPLIYVDGIQISAGFTGFGVGGQRASQLNDVNPNDIESIEIVKGPAASALYGTAAANGVILIQTKRGRPGNTQWSFYAETGEVEDVTDYPLNVASFQANDASQPLFRDSDGRFNTAAYRYCSNIEAANGVCRQDGTFSFNTLEDPRTTVFSQGTRQRYGASVRGGTEQVRFFVSGQWEDEIGVIHYNTQDKLNFRANLDAALSEQADLSVSFGYTDGNLGLNNNDNSIFSPILNGLVGEANFIPPSETRPDEVNDANYGFGFNMTELENLVIFQDVDRYTTSANLRYRPTPWLTVNGNGGLDLGSRHDFETLQPGELPIAVSFANGFRASTRTSDYLYSGLLSAVSSFQLTDQLLSTTTLGGSYSKDHSTSTECFGSSLVPGTSSCGTTAALFDIDEDFFEVRTVGGYLQQELGWRDRVFLAGGIRGDDNSAFGADFGFVWYPSLSASWVIGEEDWFPTTEWFNTLRLRSAWGVSGLRPGFRDAVTLFAPITVASEEGDVPGVTLSSTGNVTLEPEKTTEWEIGFDAGFLRDRIGIDFTYYNKRSEDALIERRLPGSLGLTTTFWDNLGSIRNSGTELSLRVTALDLENVGLSFQLANSTLENEVEELGVGVEPIILNRGLQRHDEGFSAGGFWQKELEWNDADGNGLLSIDEVSVGDEDVFLGPSLPKWQRSLQANLRLLDWINLSSLVEGRGGNLTGNFSESFRCGFRSTRGCPAVADPNAPLELQARHIANRYHGSAIGYVEEADFYKWREVSVTLDVPARYAQRFSRLQGLRLTAAGRNLATWTDYTGLDPETVEAAGSNFNQSEFNTQPPVRYLMLRLDYNF
ncbi:MAG: SusC/RagA family TonB-linked outer membrane protein [Longimicrobiales bacterium]